MSPANSVTTPLELCHNGDDDIEQSHRKEPNVNIQCILTAFNGRRQPAHANASARPLCASIAPTLNAFFRSSSHQQSSGILKAHAGQSQVALFQVRGKDARLHLASRHSTAAALVHVVCSRQIETSSDFGFKLRLDAISSAASRLCAECSLLCHQTTNISNRNVACAK